MVQTPPPLPTLPKRKPDCHKGDFGKALLIGGSRGMTGAIALAGMAALRGGAGLVSLAVPDSCLDIVAAYEPSYMTIPLPCDTEGRLSFAAREAIGAVCGSATAFALGPGLGRSEALNELIGRLYAELSQPMVVDADALNALAYRHAELGRHSGPRIVTPHPGEFARVTARDSVPPELRRELAEQCARDWDAVVVVKGNGTIVTDGHESWINSTGNPGMATGGSGDVLTGVITALLCQGLAPLAAAQLGVHVHGLAGDLAASDLGEVSLTARDLVDFLPAAFRSLESAT